MDITSLGVNSKNIEPTSARNNSALNAKNDDANDFSSVLSSKISTTESHEKSDSKDLKSKTDKKSQKEAVENVSQDVVPSEAPVSNDTAKSTDVAISEPVENSDIKKEEVVEITVSMEPAVAISNLVSSQSSDQIALKQNIELATKKINVVSDAKSIPVEKGSSPFSPQMLSQMINLQKEVAPQKIATDLTEPEEMPEIELSATDLMTTNPDQERLKLNANQIQQPNSTELKQLNEFLTQKTISPEMMKVDQSDRQMELKQSDLTTNNLESRISNPMNVNNPATQTATPTHQFKMDMPLGNSAWREAFSENVLWLTNQSVKSANIHLNPAELGPIELSLKMNQQQATLVVNAQHVLTREAIEDAMPKLRDMLAQHGIQLNDVSVNDHSGQNQRDQLQDRDLDPGFLAEIFDNSNDLNKTTVKMSRLNEVDYYA